MEGLEKAVLAVVMTIITGVVVMWINNNKELCEKIGRGFDRAFPYLVGAMVFFFAGMVVLIFWLFVIDAIIG